MNYKELSKLSENEKQEKTAELKLELIKARVSAAKGGKTKIREIKKNLARLLMLKQQ